MQMRFAHREVVRVPVIGNHSMIGRGCRIREDVAVLACVGTEDAIFALLRGTKESNLQIEAFTGTGKKR
jgi:hypothetical protein